MKKLYNSIYGCPERGTYNFTPQAATLVSPALKGRSRYALNDIYPTKTTSVTIPMDEGQFAAFLQFWIDINKGVDWFLMDLWQDNVLSEFYTHATSAFTTSLSPDMLWEVQIPLEVRSITQEEPK